MGLIVILGPDFFSLVDIYLFFGVSGALRLVGIYIPLLRFSSLRFMIFLFSFFSSIFHYCFFTQRHTIIHFIRIFSTF